MGFLVFLFGAIIGSFLNVVIIRYPQGKSVVYPNSHCPKCNTPLKWYHNIPILSFILLRGKCAYCKMPISYQYIVVEIISAVITVCVYYKEGISWYALCTLLSFYSLIVASFIDLRYKAISYVMNVVPLTFALFSHVDVITTIKNALLFAGGAVFLRDYLSAILQKEAMGEGDILIFATLAALLGIHSALYAIFLSAILAILPAVYYIYKKKEYELPFIPFLTLGGMLVYIWQGGYLPYS